MVLDDFEFGEIIVRKNSLAKSIRFALDNSGRLRLTFPAGVSDSLIRKTIEANRSVFRENLAKTSPISPSSQRARDQKIRLLRKEAEDFLPYRLAYLAKLHKLKYKRMRITYPTTRWGSCSSNGTISLSIAIMKLPPSLRDHVILHELNHLKHMDHSVLFWLSLEKMDPKCKYHRTMLKHYSPEIWKD